jgi:hypothetical protein
MALMPCPECGWNVSTKAKACPQCGYPLTPKDRQKGEKGIAADLGDQPSTEENWLKNHPTARECSLWYRELRARFSGDVHERFCKTMITTYVDKVVRVAVLPRKGDRAVVVVEKLSKEDLAEAAAYLKNQNVLFTEKNGFLSLNVNVQQLQEKRAVHEWIAQRLSHQPATKE